MADKMTLAKVVQIMVLDNCMSDDGAFWNAYMKLSDQAQREVLVEHFPNYVHHQLDYEAGLLTSDQAEVMACGEYDEIRAVVDHEYVHCLSRFLDAVFDWSTPSPEVLEKYGGGADAQVDVV